MSIEYTAADLARWASEPREFPAATETERKQIRSELEPVLRNAGLVANGLKERRMSINHEGLLSHLKYSRQVEGAELKVEHALNGATRYFFQFMEDKGFRLTQYYDGPLSPMFSPRGSQRIMLHW
jgi:hypothetical protein